jgi:hypothetical protein
MHIDKETGHNPMFTKANGFGGIFGGIEIAPHWQCLDACALPQFISFLSALQVKEVTSLQKAADANCRPCPFCTSPANRRFACPLKYGYSGAHRKP